MSGIRMNQEGLRSFASDVVLSWQQYCFKKCVTRYQQKLTDEQYDCIKPCFNKYVQAMQFLVPPRK